LIIKESGYSLVTLEFRNIIGATKEWSFRAAKLIGGWKNGNLSEIGEIVIMTAAGCEGGRVDGVPRTLHLQEMVQLVPESTQLE
jgi:hypothetical protein